MEKLWKYTDELRQDKRQRGLSTWAVGRIARVFGEILLRLASLTLGIIVDRWANRARPPNIYLTKFDSCLGAHGKATGAHKK